MLFEMPVAIISPVGGINWGRIWFAR